MRMMATLKASCAVLASAGVLVACAKLHWMVKYQDVDDYYSFANAAAVDDRGAGFLAGYIQPRGADPDGRVPFIAKYDANGVLQWDHRFEPASFGTPYVGVNRLVVDADNAVYAVEARRGTSFGTMGILVSKFDPAGSLQWQRQEVTEPLFFPSLKADIRNDGNLHITAAGLDRLTLSLEGEIVWAFEPPSVPPGDRGDLQPYPAGRVVTAGVEAGYAVRNLGTELQMVNTSGDVLAAFNAAQLAFTNIIDASIHQDITVVLGNTDSGVVARRIISTSEGFVVDAEHLLALPDALVSFNRDLAGFCYASLDAGTLITGYVDGSLVQRWQHSIEVSPNPQYAELVDAVATPDKCNTQYITFGTEDTRTMLVVENIVTGKALAPVVIRDFAGRDLAVQGNTFLQGGITGSYSTEEGTAATLIKHTIR